MRRSTIVIPGLSLILCAVLAWHVGSAAVSSIRLSFSDEQIEIVAEAADRARDALDQSPPDVS